MDLRVGTDDPRRQLPITITWSGDGAIGRISINAEYWAAVEWSERRQAWCIEDAEGRSLRTRRIFTARLSRKKPQ
jgi:hypothetical protein